MGVAFAVEAVAVALLHGVAVDGDGGAAVVGGGAGHVLHVDVVGSALDAVADKADILQEGGAVDGVVVADGGLRLHGGVGRLDGAVVEEHVADHAFQSHAAFGLACVAEGDPFEDPVRGVLQGDAVAAVVKADGCVGVGGDADGAAAVGTRDGVGDGDGRVLSGAEPEGDRPADAAV